VRKLDQKGGRLDGAAIDGELRRRVLRSGELFTLV
jgi:hypothetical protein